MWPERVGGHKTTYVNKIKVNFLEFHTFYAWREDSITVGGKPKSELFVITERPL